MSAPRRSARIASMTRSSAPITSRVDRKMSLMNELGEAATEAIYAIRYTRHFLKACAYPEEATAEAIVWLTRLCWAVQDCHEYKLRQLFANCDDTVMDSIPVVLQHFRTLTAEARMMDEVFRQYERIPRSLVKSVCTFGVDIKDALYHN